VHPQILDDLGLVPALRHLVRTIGHAPTTLTVTSGTEAELRAIPNSRSGAGHRLARPAQSAERDRHVRSRA
jgi:signal transduction histidine kinase